MEGYGGLEGFCSTAVEKKVVFWQYTPLDAQCQKVLYSVAKWKVSIPPYPPNPPYPYIPTI